MVVAAVPAVDWSRIKLIANRLPTAAIPPAAFFHGTLGADSTLSSWSPARNFEIVNDVERQKRDDRVVGRVDMEVVVFRGDKRESTQ